MVITYYGGQFFKLQVGDTIIAYNPIGKDSKLKQARFGADIGVISLNHPDFNGIEQVTYGGREPMIINGPGEYEVKGIFINGILTNTTYEKEKKINTIYKVQFEGINLCFLGALNSTDSMTSDIRGALGSVDILFVPIGGGEVLSPSDAYKVAVSLEASVIIPMSYGGSKGADTLKTFLKEGGEGAEEVDKLTVKKKDVAEKEGEIIVIKSSA